MAPVVAAVSARRRGAAAALLVAASVLLLLLLWKGAAQTDGPVEMEVTMLAGEAGESHVAPTDGAAMEDAARVSAEMGADNRGDEREGGGGLPAEVLPTRTQSGGPTGVTAGGTDAAGTTAATIPRNGTAGSPDVPATPQVVSGTAPPMPTAPGASAVVPSPEPSMMQVPAPTDAATPSWTALVSSVPITTDPLTDLTTTVAPPTAIPAVVPSVTAPSPTATPSVVPVTTAAPPAVVPSVAAPSPTATPAVVPVTTAAPPVATPAGLPTTIMASAAPAATLAAPTTSTVAPMTMPGNDWDAPLGFLHPTHPDYLQVPPSQQALLAAVAAYMNSSSAPALAALPREELCARRFVVTYVPGKSFGNGMEEFFNSFQLALLANRTLVLRDERLVEDRRLLWCGVLPTLAQARALLATRACEPATDDEASGHVRRLDVLKKDWCVPPAAIPDRFVTTQDLYFLDIRGLYRRWALLDGYEANLPFASVAMLHDPAALGMAFLVAFRPHSGIRRAVTDTVRRLRALPPAERPAVSVHVRHRVSGESREVLKCLACLLRWRAVEGHATDASDFSMFVAADLPESIGFLSTPAAQEQYHDLTAVCSSVDRATARQRPYVATKPLAQPTVPTPDREEPWRPWTIHSFNTTAFAATNRADADALNAIVAGVTAWGQPGKPGWWGPGPLWAALVDLYVLAALAPAVFVGSTASTFTESALALALALGDRSKNDRLWATLSNCAIPEHAPTAFALHGLLGLPSTPEQPDPSLCARSPEAPAPKRARKRR